MGDALRVAAQPQLATEMSIAKALYFMRSRQFDKAIESINKGLQRGGVKRPDNARLVLGMAYFNTNQYEKAREAFRAAGRDERSKEYARQWIKYMNSEIERQQKLAEG